jgi:hypothetical protein
LNGNFGQRVAADAAAYVIIMISVIHGDDYEDGYLRCSAVYKPERGRLRVQ